MTDLLTVENLVALLALTSLEIVLGIDNIVFLAIITGKLDESIQSRARFVGLSLAMIMRIVLLLGIKWVMGLTKPWFVALGHDVTGKDLVLLVGGLFLLAKATYEIHDKLESTSAEGPRRAAAGFAAAVAQIVVLDLVFSLDSVITAVGMAKHLWVMIAAVIIAVAIMMVFADRVTRLIERHPTLKMLALSFLILVGVMLVAEGCGKHIEKGYIYFAMGFSLVVEMLNIRVRRVTGRAAHKGAA